VWEGILLLPLVGVINEQRAARILENTLETIGQAAAEVLIMDITGVPVVDTRIASYLIQSIQAAQLLGCESVLVGISPQIAQTLVALGIDFSHITTRATLQQGLAAALER
jgi:rsbT co-antagonist protein RsbR